MIMANPNEIPSCTNNYNGLNLTDLLNDESDYEVHTLSLTFESKYYDLNDIIANHEKLKNKFSILSLNVQCLNAKWSLIKTTLSYLESKNIHFSAICFQETWLNDEPSSLFNLTNYHSPYHLPCTCSKHGGVMTYISKQFNAKELPIYKKSDIWDGQFIEIKDINSNKKIIISNIYRPPHDNNSNDNIQKFINEISPILNKFESHKNVIFTGDYNIDLLELNQRDIFNNYFDTLVNKGYFPVITNPTRFSNTRESLLDHIFVKSNNDSKTYFAGILTSKISDHLATFFVLPLQFENLSKPKYITICKSSPQNKNNFLCELNNIDWNSKLKTRVNDDPNSNYECFIKIITDLIDKHLPTKKVQFNKYQHKLQPWVTSGILKSIQYKDKLYKTWRKTSHSSPLREQYKESLNMFMKILKKVLFKAEKDYYATQFQKFTKDIKNTWKTLKFALNKNRCQKNIPGIMKFKNCFVQGDINIASKFNDFFINIAKELTNNLNQPNDKTFESYLRSPINSTFHFRHVTCKEISDIIQKLNNKNSTGYDNISLNFIKSVSNPIIYPMSLMINQSLFSGIFPDKLKIAKVLPIHKKDAIDICNNYRPISLLPNFSKIFEKIVFNQTLEYFTSNNLFFPSQHGFRPNHSTETAATELLDILKLDIDKGHVPVGVFLDLSKAFDTIDHNILLNKLKYYGLGAIALKWFQSYLTNRKQYVIVNSEESSLQSLILGVPQGSILGPLLFLIYMNDINTCSQKFKFLCFADDTTIILSLCHNLKHKKNCENVDINLQEINNELNRLYEWLTVNMLSINLDKTKYMVFHNPQRNLTQNPKYDYLAEEPSLIKINNIPIERVKFHMFLGFKIDENLNWKEHVNYISNKISKTIGIIKKLKTYIPQQQLKILYSSLILPYIQYGIINWCYQVNRIEILQKKCLRLISNSYPYEHTEKLFKSFKILKIKDIFIQKCLVFFHKFKNNTLPDHCMQLITYFTNNTRYNLRQMNNKILAEQYFNLKTSENCLRYALPNVLNNLSPTLVDLTDLGNIDLMKQKIKLELINSYNDEDCNLNDCYPCNKRLFYPKYLSKWIQLISIYSYTNPLYFA